MTIKVICGPLRAMSRKLKVEYPGAIYHLIHRGDRREAIFRDDADHPCFLNTLGEACGKHCAAGRRRLEEEMEERRSDQNLGNRPKGDPYKVATAWRRGMGSANMVPRCLRFRWEPFVHYRHPLSLKTQ